MLRYALVFLLVNTYGLSWGLPVQTSNGTIKIGNLLSELAKGCKNEFVVGVINSKLEECHREMPPIMSDSLIRCSMFYDASFVLCNLTANSPELSTDYTVKTTEKQDLTAFCTEAAHFSLPPTRFRTKIGEVFHKELPCAIVCADEDILSGGTSFYCKYYKWMLGIVAAHSAQITPVINNLSGNQVSVDEQTKINDTLVADTASASDGSPKKDEFKETSSDTNNKVSTNTVDASQVHVDAAHPDPAAAPLTDLKKVLNLTDTAVEPKNSLENTVVDSQLGKLDKQDARNNIHIENVLPENGIGHGIEAPKLSNGLDGEEDDQGLDDTNDQGDPDDVGEGMEDIDAESKPEHSDKKPVEHGEASLKINSESSHGDTYLNPMEGYTDDDDHFFPFFLTAVIVVVVLYILYHNKNKVGKMFFGLIVEGRQSGRRRTSRGHAYRRLDTLEQAMSANTTAPPSKIIY